MASTSDFARSRVTSVISTSHKEAAVTAFLSLPLLASVFQRLSRTFATTGVLLTGIGVFAIWMATGDPDGRALGLGMLSTGAAVFVIGFFASDLLQDHLLEKNWYAHAESVDPSWVLCDGISAVALFAAVGLLRRRSGERLVGLILVPLVCAATVTRMVLVEFDDLTFASFAVALYHTATVAAWTVLGRQDRAFYESRLWTVHSWFISSFLAAVAFGLWACSHGNYQNGMVALSPLCARALLSVDRHRRSPATQSLARVCVLIALAVLIQLRLNEASPSIFGWPTTPIVTFPCALGLILQARRVLRSTVMVASHVTLALAQPILWAFASNYHLQSIGFFVQDLVYESDDLYSQIHAGLLENASWALIAVGVVTVILTLGLSFCLADFRVLVGVGSWKLVLYAALATIYHGAVKHVAYAGYGCEALVYGVLFDVLIFLSLRIGSSTDTARSRIELSIRLGLARSILCVADPSNIFPCLVASVVTVLAVPLRRTGNDRLYACQLALFTVATGILGFLPLARVSDVSTLDTPALVLSTVAIGSLPTAPRVSFTLLLGLTVWCVLDANLALLVMVGLWLFLLVRRGSSVPTVRRVLVESMLGLIAAASFINWQSDYESETTSELVRNTGYALVFVLSISTSIVATETIISLQLGRETSLSVPVFESIWFTEAAALWLLVMLPSQVDFAIGVLTCLAFVRRLASVNQQRQTVSEPAMWSCVFGLGSALLKGGLSAVEVQVILSIPFLVLLPGMQLFGNRTTKMHEESSTVGVVILILCAIVRISISLLPSVGSFSGVRDEAGQTKAILEIPLVVVTLVALMSSRRRRKRASGDESYFLIVAIYAVVGIVSSVRPLVLACSVAGVSALGYMTVRRVNQQRKRFLA